MKSIQNEHRSSDLGRAAAMLSAVAYLAKKFGRGSSWQDGAADALGHLGEAAEVSRVYLYENSKHDSELVMSLVYEWCGPDIEPMIGGPANQNYPYSIRLQRWQELLSHGEIVHGPARNFPASEREDIIEEGALSTAAIPVFCEDEWWGYIGFDDCVTEREWSEIELDTLRAAAEIFGATIERQHRTKKLRKSNLLFKALVDQIPAVLYIEGCEDDDDVEEFVSPNVESMTGISREAWLAEDQMDEMWFSRVHPDDRERMRVEWVEHRLTEKAINDYRIVHPDGRVVWFRDRSTLIRDEDGKPIIEIGLMLDVTELKEAEQQITFLAYHDKLTGLANRALFEEMLESSMARAKREKLAVAVLYMDLDDFKSVNDGFGHAAGDELLKQIAARLMIATRDSDLVTRQGGDEFLVLLPDLPLGGDSRDPTRGDQAVRIAESMAERIRELVCEPFAIGEVEIESSVSVGISVFPIDASDSRGLLKIADAAMYQSKKRLLSSDVS